MKITVVGIGYVGLANAILLAQNHSVTLIDIVSEKVNLINQRKSPIEDSYISEYLESIKLDLNATMDQDMAYKTAELIILATPTDYDPATNFFNTKSIEESIDTILKVNNKAPILIKSTLKSLGKILSIKSISIVIEVSFSLGLSYFLFFIPL